MRAWPFLCMNYVLQYVNGHAVGKLVSSSHQRSKHSNTFTIKLFFSVQTFRTFTVTCQFYFVLKIYKLHLLYTSAAINLVHFSLDFIMINENFQRKIVNIFLPISFNICFGCSKEPSL